MIEKYNIYNKCQNIQKNTENTEIIVKNGSLKIEKIVSNNAKTKEGYWYNQKTDEFVIVLKGSARLLFTNGKSILMKKGDYIIIPKKTKHKVLQTSKNCVWLAFFGDLKK